MIVQKHEYDGPIKQSYIFCKNNNEQLVSVMFVSAFTLHIYSDLFCITPKLIENSGTLYFPLNLLMPYVNKLKKIVTALYLLLTYFHVMLP